MNPLIEVAVHTCLVYIALVLLLRFLGRRQMGQLNLVDLVIVVVLGSAVETGMVAGNTSLAAGLVSATTLLLINRLLTEVVRRSRFVRHALAIGPLLLIHDGVVCEQHLKRAGLTSEDLLEAIRERELDEVTAVRFAVLEADGEITVIPKSVDKPKGDNPGTSA